MKKIIWMMCLGLIMGACATTTEPVEPTTPTEPTAVAPQIKDEEVFHMTADMINSDVPCARCGIVEQQMEMEYIYQKVAEQAAAAGKTVEEFLTPSVLQP